MKIISIIKKNILQKLRSPLNLGLTLFTVPAFALFYKLVLREGSSEELKAVSGTLNSSAASFNQFVPGLLVFAIIMLVFSVSISVSREAEYGTFLRLRFTDVRSYQLITGIGFVELLLGALSLSLTYFLARYLGFETNGNMLLILWSALLTAAACVGIGVIVGSLSQNTVRAFLIASLAMFAMILFSGIVFKSPEVYILKFNTFKVGLFDFLPPSLMHKGLVKIIHKGAGFKDLTYELSSLSLLTVIYFTVGIFNFNRSFRRAF